MNNMKKSMKRIFWMFVLLFLLAIGYILKLSVLDRETIAVNSYNPRLNYTDTSMLRGDIKDINGTVIAYSEKNGDTYDRVYPFGEVTCHVTGYTAVGKAGIEATENFELQKAHNEIFQRLRNAFTGEEVVGNDVILTIDMDIQDRASKLMGTKKGSITVMDPSTGKIIAMYSYPSFDPNLVAQEWETLREKEGSPLLNRASQGLYPPGSTFKLVTALSAMEYLPDWENYTYTCNGEATFDGKVIHCYNNRAHGEVNMQEAMAVSCNCFFAQIASEIGSERLRETGDQVYLNQSIPFLLDSSTSRMTLDSTSSVSELVETSIGQGKTLVTPLYMALLTCAIANEGIMMEPYVIDHYEYENGESSGVHVPEKIDQIMTPQQANVLKEMMVQVVEEGTGTAAKGSAYTFAGKTGTAENAEGNDHAWFVCLAPAEDPQVVVSIILENGGSGSQAVPIAVELAEMVLEKNQTQ